MAAFGMALGSALNHYMTRLFGPAPIKDLGWSKADFTLIGSLPIFLMIGLGSAAGSLVMSVTLRMGQASPSETGEAVLDQSIAGEIP